MIFCGINKFSKERPLTVLKMLLAKYLISVAANDYENFLIYGAHCTYSYMQITPLVVTSFSPFSPSLQLSQTV